MAVAAKVEEPADELPRRRKHVLMHSRPTEPSYEERMSVKGGVSRTTAPLGQTGLTTTTTTTTEPSYGLVRKTSIGEGSLEEIVTAYCS